MKPLLTVLGIALLASFPAFAAEPPAAMPAAELAGRMSAKQQDGASFIRLKMVNSGGKSALQLQIKSRVSRGSTELVYQVLFPKERKGESVLMRKSGSRMSGALFTPPDASRLLGANQLDESLLGSALSYEDVIDNFFAWDQQTVVGTEMVERVNCTILESKPGKGERSSYQSVRSWIDPNRFVPMRVEKYSAPGRLARRIDTTRVVTDDKGRAVPANLAIRGSDGSTTELEGSKLKHSVTFADAEFTPEGLATLTAPQSGPE